MTDATRKFIRDHAADDLSQLLLNASRYQDVDVREAVTQIKAQKQIKDKLPEWYRDDRLIFPSSLAVEQSSSVNTALYKQRLVREEDRLCDLTGGLGVDTFYLSKKVRHIIYIEKNKACCDAAHTNFCLLGVTNVQIINDDAKEILKKKDGRLSGLNVFYIDPSRRGAGDRRLFTLNECEPDLKQIMALLPKPYRMIIKLSPMLDVSQALSQIPSVQEVHVISVKNECKELLFVSETSFEQIDSPCDSADETGSLPDANIYNNKTKHPKPDPLIYCVNYTTDGTEQAFCFRLSDERTAVASLAKSVGPFLYEPNASLLKAGAYKIVACRYGIEKLHSSSHLYTSNYPVAAFPGRIFEITEVLPFNNRMCKTINRSIRQANISVRNFPLTVEELRKRTRISDGGDVFLFATTLPDNQKALIKCHKK